MLELVTAIDSRSRLFDIAESQFGYFTAGQALEAGYSYASQAYHNKVGNWERDGWGIYRLVQFPRFPNEAFVRLMLWSRNRAGVTQATVSHESALSIYELSDVLPSAYHLTVPFGFRKSPPAGVHLYFANMANEDIRRRDGFRITTPLRTLIDVAGSGLSPELLEAATQEALQRGLVLRKALTDAIENVPQDVRDRFAYLGPT